MVQMVACLPLVQRVRGSIPGGVVKFHYFHTVYSTRKKKARRVGSDGSMPASVSAGPGFDPRRASKFSFEKLSTSWLGGEEMYTF